MFYSMDANTAKSVKRSLPHPSDWTLEITVDKEGLVWEIDETNNGGLRMSRFIRWIRCRRHDAGWCGFARTPWCKWCAVEHLLALKKTAAALEGPGRWRPPASVIRATTSRLAGRRKRSTAKEARPTRWKDRLQPGETPGRGPPRVRPRPLKSHRRRRHQRPKKWHSTWRRLAFQPKRHLKNE